jgi:hypothetical protein
MAEPDPDMVWGLLLATGFAYEVYALLNKTPGDTLSERTRAWFRTHKQPGRAVFAAAWLGFATWFFVHILW